MRRPVILTAPWRRAVGISARQPGVLAGSLVAGFVVGLVAAAPVLFVSSVGAGAVQVQTRLECPANLSPTVSVPRSVTLARAVPGNEVPDPLTTITAAAAGDPAFAAAEHLQAGYSPHRARLADREAQLGFLATPDALAHVEVLAGPVPGDLWLPDTVAEQLAAGPGSGLDVTMQRSARVVHFTVAGVFRDLAARPLDGYWCALRTAIVPATLYGEIYPPPMGIVDPAVFDERELMEGLAFSRYVVPFARPPRTLADARRLDDAASGFRERLTALAPEFRSTAGIDRLTSRAEQVRAAIRDTSTPVAAMAVVCAFVLAAVVGVLWLRARRATGVALATLGIGPVALGLKAGLEIVVPVFVGALGGSAAARATLHWWAPSSAVEPGWGAAAVVAGAVAALVAVVLAATVAGSGTRSLLRVAASRRRVSVAWVPLELVLGAAAWLAWRGLRTRATPGAGEGRRVVDTSSVALTFPLAVLAVAAVVAARLWWLATRARPSPTVAARFGRHLAFRRLQHGSRAGTAVLAAGTLALGVSVYGAATTASLGYTARAKSAVFVGSDVAYLVAKPLPPGTPGATEVWQRESMTYAGQEVDVLAVDPATFADVAFWDSAFADRPLRALIAELVARPGVGALAVGDVPSSGELSNPKTIGPSAPVQVVERVRAFPGAGTVRPTLVLTRAGAEATSISFQRYVWAKGGMPFWRAELLRLGTKPVTGISRADAVDGSALEFASWSFEFVGALGVFVGGLVTAALVMQLTTRQRQQALGFAFMRRMGLRARRHWWALALEVGAMVVTTLVLGSVVALGCSRVVNGRTDPLPRLAPSTLTLVPWTALAVTMAVGAALAVAGSGVAQWLGGRVDVAARLRDDG